jgi:hypothetical protein
VDIAKDIIINDDCLLTASSWKSDDVMAIHTSRMYSPCWQTA